MLNNGPYWGNVLIFFYETAEVFERKFADLGQSETKMATNASKS